MRKTFAAALAGALLSVALPMVATPRSAAPDDPYFDLQWGLKKIGAPKAWKVTRGKGVVIAVVDGGVDLEHPDLASKLIVNAAADIVEPDGEDGPDDPRGHGTHVAGIAAAKADNGIGIAGVAPRAKILPVRVMGSDGTGETDDAATGVRYAADHGADVINLSLGVNGAQGEVFALTGDMAPLEEAIAYAFERGVVIVAAAGNETFPMCGNPANQAHVICVGATGPDDMIASYSNFDATQASRYVVAPGGEPAGLTCESFILSTWPTSLTPTACGPPEQVGYDVNTGTSMAAPFVAGVAALLVSEGFGNRKIAKCLTRTAKDLGEEGRDPVYGYGRVRANAAVRNC